MLEEITICVGRGDNFAFETTLSGTSWLRAIRQWRDSGYRVSLYFLSLPTAEMAIARVAARVSQGGHDVAESVIRRRFASGLDNFHRHYKLAVDDWTLYDNSGAKPVLLEFGDNT